jgi:translation initiation factor 2 subunit 1
MFYKKEGIPEEGELVICTVKKLLTHCVFVKLDEYRNLEGMLHISEVAPGRIRNIRDYIKENKKIICKVLRIKKERNQIDLSLRRVSISARNKKNTEYKQEEKAEKILEIVAKKLKIDLQDIYKKAGNKLIEEYGTLNLAFQNLIEGKTDFKELKIPEKELKILKETIKEKIKPIRVEVKTKLNLKSYANNGIEIIKETLDYAKKFAKKNNKEIKIEYISAPTYRIILNGPDYKSTEKTMDELINNTIKFIKENNGEGEKIK